METITALHLYHPLLVYHICWFQCHVSGTMVCLLLHNALLYHLMNVHLSLLPERSSTTTQPSCRQTGWSGDWRCWCWYLAKVPGSRYRVLVGASKYDPILRQDILGQLLIAVHVHHVACCQDTSQAIQWTFAKRCATVTAGQSAARVQIAHKSILKDLNRTGCSNARPDLNRLTNVAMKK